VEPQFVNGDIPLLLELIRPFPSVLVLYVLPFWSNALLEEVIVGLQGKFGCRGDIILKILVSRRKIEEVDSIHIHPRTPRLS
jgi:hypothetical protein